MNDDLGFDGPAANVHFSRAVTSPNQVGRKDRPVHTTCFLVSAGRRTDSGGVAPLVAVVHAAYPWQGHDSGFARWGWNHRPAVWAVLAQPKMTAILVIVTDV